MAAAKLPECTGCNRTHERTERGVRKIRLAKDGTCRACREAAFDAMHDLFHTPGSVLQDKRTGRLWLVCVRQSTHRGPMLAPLGKQYQRDDYMGPVFSEQYKHFIIGRATTSVVSARRAARLRKGGK